MASSSAIKPDWSVSTEFKTDLSGQQVTFSLPSGMSQERPNALKDKINIYDRKVEGQWTRFDIADVWWEYKKRLFFILPESLGTLMFRVAVHYPENSEINLFDPNVLQGMVNDMYLLDFPSDDKRIPKTFEQITVNNNTWIKYDRLDRFGDKEGVRYAIAITPSHFLDVSFNIAKMYDYAENNWHDAAQADIERIINSFNLVLTPQYSYSHTRWRCKQPLYQAVIGNINDGCPPQNVNQGGIDAGFTVSLKSSRSNLIIGK